MCVASLNQGMGTGEERRLKAWGRPFSREGGLNFNFEEGQHGHAARDVRHVVKPICFQQDLPN